MTEQSAGVKIGTIITDGTVYAGISRDTNKPIGVPTSRFSPCPRAAPP